MEKLGWFVSNNERGDMVIQKDDDIERFKNDDEATLFVEKSYAELLEALKELVKTINDNTENEWIDGEEYLCVRNQYISEETENAIIAINKAENKEK